MGKLIDAGKILDRLSGMLKNMNDYDAVRKVINDMPTAYDVDKVVEQLENERKKSGNVLFWNGLEAGDTQRLQSW